MPWEIRKGPPCPASKPYGVYKKGTDEKVGCSATRENAEAQLRALYASENDEK